MTTDRRKTSERRTNKSLTDFAECTHEDCPCHGGYYHADRRIATQDRRKPIDRHARGEFTDQSDEKAEKLGVAVRTFTWGCGCAISVYHDKNHVWLKDKITCDACSINWKSRYDALLEIGREMKDACPDILDSQCESCTFENPHTFHIEKLRKALAKFAAWEKEHK